MILHIASAGMLQVKPGDLRGRCIHFGMSPEDLTAKYFSNYIQKHLAY